MISTLSAELQERVRASDGDRCGYCWSPQHLMLGPLEIEHVIPTARGGSDDEADLWLACRMCNNFKGTQTHALDPVSGQRRRLFNPRTQRWARHFRWTEDGTQVCGRTATGRATVIALRLYNVIDVTMRQARVAAGRHPPRDGQPRDTASEGDVLLAGVGVESGTASAHDVSGMGPTISSGRTAREC